MCVAKTSGSCGWWRLQRRCVLLQPAGFGRIYHCCFHVEVFVPFRVLPFAPLLVVTLPKFDASLGGARHQVVLAGVHAPRLALDLHHRMNSISAQPAMTHLDSARAV